MQTALKNRTLLLCALGLSFSCVPAQTAAQLEAQQQFIQQQVKENQLLRIEQQRMGAQLENLERAWWSDKFCRSEKGEKNFKFSARIAEFMGQVQASVPEVCTEGNLESSLTFMNTQAYANSYFGRNAGLNSIHVARREQLIDLFADRFLHPSTRFLVLVQPSEQGEADRIEALQLGEKLIDMLRREIAPQHELKILGPHLLPCRMRQEIRRLYRSPMDQTLFGEPVEGMPRIRVWVFRTDC